MSWALLSLAVTILVFTGPDITLRPGEDKRGVWPIYAAYYASVAAVAWAAAWLESAG